MTIFKISTEQAGTDLDKKAADLQVADEAVQVAEAKLAEADLVSDATQVVRQESTLIKVKLERARAARALKAAEERFDMAQDEAMGEALSKAQRQRDKALKSRREGAKLIDNAYASIAQAVIILQEADETLHLCSISGVISINAVSGYTYGPERTRQLLKFAEAKAGLPGAEHHLKFGYGGQAKHIPSTSELVKRDNATLLSDLQKAS